MLGLLVKWLVTSVSLFIISKLPFVGVKIDSFGKAIFSAVVFGILNVLAWPLIAPLNLIWPWLAALPLFILNVIIFGVAAALVQGFSLENKILSPIFGAFLLTLLNKIINHFLPFGEAAAKASDFLSGGIG